MSDPKGILKGLRTDIDHCDMRLIRRIHAFTLKQKETSLARPVFLEPVEPSDLWPILHYALNYTGQVGGNTKLTREVFNRIGEYFPRIKYCVLGKDIEIATEDIVDQLAARSRDVKAVAAYKKQNNITVTNPTRDWEVFNNAVKNAKEVGFDPVCADAIIRTIVYLSKQSQGRILGLPKGAEFQPPVAVAG